MTRTWLRFSLAQLVLLPACAADDDGNTGAGTGASTGSDATTVANTMTGDPTMTTSPTTTSMTTSPTTTDPDTTADSTTAGETDTGELPCPYTPVDGMPAVGLQLVGNGFDRPVLALGHPTEPDRLFVVEQGGAVRILEPGQTVAPADAFLQLEVSCGGNGTIGCERGLLGFAFHPQFPDDPRVYVAYSPAGTPGDPPTRVSEFALAEGDPNHVDADSERIIIEGSQPAGNHNGGMIAFGPDDYLYFGLGDGGNANDDPQQTARDPSVILAKILRLDVEPDGTPDMPVSCSFCDDNGPFDYTIPADNPFVDDGDFTPEVYAWGFRNPWRFSFDPGTGDLYVGDVGQDEVEEVDVVVAGGDHGWHVMEGNNCFQGSDCDTSAAPGQVNGDGMTAPIIEYPHSQGCSVTGFGVYRSCEVPAWDGIYFYGDYCAGNLAALVWDGATVTDLGDVLDIGELPLGTGWNAYGDVFVTTVDAVPNGPISDGLVYRIAPQ
jgi:glucose/arabinose dehydrogenase